MSFCANCSVTRALKNKVLIAIADLEKIKSVLSEFVDSVGDGAIPLAPSASENKRVTRLTTKAKAGDNVVAWQNSVQRRPTRASANKLNNEQSSSNVHKNNNNNNANTDTATADANLPVLKISNESESNTGLTTFDDNTDGDSMHAASSSASANDSVENAASGSAVGNSSGANGANDDNIQAESATDKGQTDNAQWSIVANRRHKKQNQRNHRIIGSNVETQLGVIVRRKWLHLSSFVSTVTSDDIIAYVANRADINP
ncbi:PREDICTED: putative mediator of RNA polymerase II transcription subunit 29, partial [Rhagoletis zephyria]|uniref:putative mediator of RNA polymerase II transcription subunit 29 n=1 Tax=Rhagoletis zephyria TaxID=28612 RepID=UPI0008118A76